MAGLLALLRNSDTYITYCTGYLVPGTQRCPPTTSQDMAPYVGLLMPELQAAVVDPLPEVRATAARALGSLLRGMGADHFSDLVPWLLATLRSEVRLTRLYPSTHDLCRHMKHQCKR